MFDLFKRLARPAPFEAAGLGATVVARPIGAGCPLPPGTVGVAVDRAGRARRIATGGRIALLEGESGWCFHPGPYGCDLVPFAASPEIGLRTGLVVDSPDPRMTQQRFDLFLASEAEDELTLAGLVAAIESALQRELAQGKLSLPPCTTLEEWNAFRAGFNQLLYTRFGLTVDDCVPVDLADRVDYAQLLRTRAAAAAPGGAAQSPAVASAAAGVKDGPHPAPEPAHEDARALRRLFLELPCVLCGLRMAALPADQALFRQQQALLARLDLASLAAGTMPALALAAPNQPLAIDAQRRRVRQSRRAAGALDEAWALLARLERPGDEELAALFDDLERIVANLEAALEARKRVAPVEDEA